VTIFIDILGKDPYEQRHILDICTRERGEWRKGERERVSSWFQSTASRGSKIKPQTPRLADLGLALAIL